jgi:hypothetical protein
VSVVLVGTPARLRYGIGEAFDLTGLTLDITYDDSTSDSGIPVTASMLGPAGWNATTGTG